MAYTKILAAAAAVAFTFATFGIADAAQMKSRSHTAVPTASGNLKGNGKPVGDLYCKNNSRHHVPCDIVFVNYCKLIGGKLSGRQGWGGKTCFHPHEW